MTTRYLEDVGVLAYLVLSSLVLSSQTSYASPFVQPVYICPEKFPYCGIGPDVFEHLGNVFYTLVGVESLHANASNLLEGVGYYPWHVGVESRSR